MIGLRSGTVTLLSDEMCEVARDATVGDDVYGDGPTVNELEARAAEPAGKEAVLFVPSGTMGSQVAARAHANPGRGALVDKKTHVYERGVGGSAQLSGLQVRAYDAGEHAAPAPTQVRDYAHGEPPHAAGTGVLYLEDTHNAHGGVAVPKADIDAAANATRDLGAPVRLDGARLFNACVALDGDPATMAERVDTVMCYLSKGLDAPIGSMLADPEAFIEEVVCVRKQFGGGIRQTGLITAPGLAALGNVGRLADDHANATVLAEGLDVASRLSVPTPDANIVVVNSEGAGLAAEEFVESYDDVGVLGDTFDQYHTHFTTNLNVSRADVERAVDLITDVVEPR